MAQTRELERGKSDGEERQLRIPVMAIMDGEWLLRTAPVDRVVQSGPEWGREDNGAGGERENGDP
jgi:hypothetical protein